MDEGGPEEEEQEADVPCPPDTVVEAVVMGLTDATGLCWCCWRKREVEGTWDDDEEAAEDSDGGGG